MERLFKAVIIILVGNLCFADESLIALSRKSAELQANFKQCGFCAEKRKELESFNEDELIPALERAGRTIQKKPNSSVAKTIIDIALANRESAAEGFSNALGDAYAADSKTFLRLIENLKTSADKKFIFEQTSWGVQNSTGLPKAKLNKLLGELNSIKAKNLKER